MRSRRRYGGGCVDARMIPSGESEAFAIAPGRLGGRSFDDLCTDLERPARFVLVGGGRRISVAFDDGYRFAQIYVRPSDR